MVHLVTGKTGVYATTLGTYSEEEVRKFSVVQVTVPATLDPLSSKPIPGGLYDLRMGPEGPGGQRCETCTLSHASCPGHFGHIELCLPLFNPLLMQFTNSLLGLCCHNCFSLKLSEKRTARYAEILRNLRGSRNCSSSGTSTSSPDSSLDVYSETPEAFGDEAAAQNLLERLFAEVNSTAAKCERCGQISPKYMVDGNNRILQVVSGTVTALGRGDDNEIIDTQVVADESSDDEDEDEDENDDGDEDDYDREDASDEDDGRDDEEDTKAKKRVKKKDDERKKAEANASDDEGAVAPKRKKVGGKRAKRGKQIKLQHRYVSPTEAKTILDRAIVMEKGIFGDLLRISDPDGKSRRKVSSDFLFLNVLPVTPPRFRPMSKVNDQLFDHPQNVVYSDILMANARLAKVVAEEEISKKALGLQQLWVDLQTSCNKLLGGDGQSSDASLGLRNLIEKKEGIFRMNMMGKRVNYAARSVISPDPYIALGEIGLPPYFAERLSFPEHVNDHNKQKLSRMVANGAKTYPGALMVENARTGVKIELRSEKSRRGEAQVMKGEDSKGKIVHRHAQTGDVVLVNRQPTLHKPSILAHNCRVLQGERTIRLHYANCSGYNADFDGDEINIHLPQDQMSRAEAYTIMHSNENFVVPTDGKPIKGLIQDHVISSVYLTMQDTFLEERHYKLLVYEACCILKPTASSSAGSNLTFLGPTLFKPAKLWTGKQVISTILLNVLSDSKFTFTGEYKTKVNKNYFCAGSMESQVYVRRGHLIHGVVDKAQYGKYGLVHSIQELYGAETMAFLMGCFSRLFTKYLQIRGFTCSIDDLSLNASSEAQRTLALERSASSVSRATEDLLGMAPAHDTGRFGAESDPSPERTARLEQSLRQELLGHNKEAFGAKFDAVCTGALNDISSSAVNSCLPQGSTKQFPRNNFNMMTSSGAKGSSVNHSQISVLLGQQTLEGRRVPRMESGKTLPCFLPYTIEPRSSGFIADRFLTGLQPQEYYFHCMAGREGLVDTTVKTARSGYLQRCLVKSLECLSVKYDGTVRDSRGGFKPKAGEAQPSGKSAHHHHGSIVQFRYGEDGVDPMKESYLYKFGFLVQNCMPLAQKLKQSLDLSGNGPKPSGGGGGPLCRFDQAWEDYAGNGDKGETERKRRKKEGRAKRALKGLLDAKLESSLACAGDAVGVVAAQSIGEPSTQMTLNTFHHAGRGEANVTLGIPRLREILMTATKEIKTPYIRAPFLGGAPLRATRQIAAKLRKIGLLEILKTLKVEERPLVLSEDSKAVVQAFRVEFAFHPLEIYESRADLVVTKRMVQRCVEKDFWRGLQRKLRGFTKKQSRVTKFSPLSDKTGACALEIEHESLRKLPMLELCERVAMTCFLNENLGVETCERVVTEDGRDGLLVQGGAGELLRDCLLAHFEVMDMSRLESNDIHMMQETFGIEAARRVLENEVIKVFGAYGIQVDPRHLSLVSDFMTHSGQFKGCNRGGSFPLFGSPLLQMSFETATQFLRKSVLFNTVDEMRSPSSNIACGQLVTTSGTGLVELLWSGGGGGKGSVISEH